MQTGSTSTSVTTATLNINGAWSPLKRHLLNSFLHRNNIDITALQEVVYTDFEFLRGYTAHVNIGDSGRGTAIVVKQGIQVKDTERIPSGRAIAAEFQSYRMVNVYDH
jgi:exonuclease III